jgi:hypothetical protein
MAQQNGTDLLLPFVSNQAGFDTAIVVTNTSLDPIGTTPVGGTCTFKYYGNTTGGGAAPPPQTSAPIPAGQQLLLTLSVGGTHNIGATPGFQGYMVISCAFPFAESYAVISDVGLQRLAQGYRAAVLADKKTKPGNTVLLFPFVSNQAGFDTGMAITNTTLHPQGTDAVSGTCTLYYYGNTPGGGAAPPPQTSAPISAGQQLILSLSSGGTHNIMPTAGFQGYIVAKCGFPAAPGFAFLSDLGSQRLAFGYLASELPPDKRK